MPRSLSLEAAVRLIEGVRGRLQESRFRSGYVEDKFEVYLELMRLQLQQGRTADAFSTAERLRARSFVEQLGGRASVPLSASDRRTEVELRERVRRLQQSLADTDDDGAPGVPRASDEPLLAGTAARREGVPDVPRRSRPRPRALPARVPSVASIQRRLAADQALLEYVVGPESLVVFVLTSRGITVKSSPLRESDLAARIELLRDLIRRPGDDRWRKPAARLSAELIDPLERAGWLDGVTRLYIVPHGALDVPAVCPAAAAGAGPAATC